ncbi:hypothetical protein [Klenkia taihuensis]|uniref:DUF2975 domain-containing protein n=1 Tax=Klenkia taihuensis TaxID=1225127 RepID=A0A1I1V461_9ACTN|nr:hypothetical protein [Klenkia taihuensis]GHE14545.1 hypothetical protein GCM10011381_41570 [Klenkia taihuensis]SFD77615.1 hypothetical protein SAMN05661030_4197 [Klenkia taihuensis]
MTSTATRPLLGPRSSRTLSVVLAGLATLAVGAVVVRVTDALTFASVLTEVTLTTRTRLDLDAALRLPEELTLSGHDVVARLVADDLPAGTRLLVVTGEMLPWLCAGLAALAFARVVWGLGSGDPFRPGHARLVVAIAVLWAVGSWVTPQVVRAGSVEVLAFGGNPAGLEPATDSSSIVVTWFGLLLLLAVAEVFRRGARQAHEVEGLV